VTPGTLTVTANNASRVYGAANPTFTDSITGFVNGDTSSVVSGAASLTTTATTTSAPGSYTITAATGTLGAANYTFSFVNGTLTVAKDSTTTSASATISGQSATFTATVAANSPGSGTPTGTVDFYDTTTSTDLSPSGVTLSGGKATFTATLPTGSQTITVTYSGAANFLTSSGTVAVAPAASVYVLNSTASGALTISGNGDIDVPGSIDVDSSSSSAISASGNAIVTASSIQVAGNYSASGNAHFTPTPTIKAASVADPLASLAVPSVSGSAITENLSGNSSATINPGLYTSITVSGNGVLTMNPGIYAIEGGGFTVSGNGAVTATGVMIYNAGSKYPSTGGTFGAINLSGNGKFTLSAPTTGIYAGLGIFQSRDNTQAINLSGNNITGITGSIYAADAELVLSGNAQLKDALIVGTMNLSGNAIFNTLSSTSGAYTPDQIRGAYNINSVPYDGTGQTIAIVDAYDDPVIDLAVDEFDSQFSTTASGSSLYQQYGPASSFLTVMNQDGQASSLPVTDPSGVGVSNWEMEEELDVEWTHAIAPGAQVILVEANSQSLSDLMTAVATAADQPNVSVVSMSWGFQEGTEVLAQDEARYDSYLTTPAGHEGVTFVASTGDYGAAVPEYPALSPNVVAVGGTSLTLNSDNSYNSETGWGGYSQSVGTFIGSGGDASQYEAEPAYQMGVQSTGYRTDPDVSFVADPNTGVWIADPYNLSSGNPWETVGGTSLSAPAWAGLFALVNQGRIAAGESTIGSPSDPTATQTALYEIPASDYNAISTGNNGYAATAGYNLVTGLGTPIANLLVSDLIANTVAPSSQRSVTVTTATLQEYSGGGGGSGGANIMNVFDAMVMSSGHVPATASARNGDAETVPQTASLPLTAETATTVNLGRSEGGTSRAPAPVRTIGSVDRTVDSTLSDGQIINLTLTGPSASAAIGNASLFAGTHDALADSTWHQAIVAGDGSDILMGGFGAVRVEIQNDDVSIGVDANDNSYLTYTQESEGIEIDSDTDSLS
jgi:hypothetical protein